MHAAIKRNDYQGVHFFILASAVPDVSSRLPEPEFGFPNTAKVLLNRTKLFRSPATNIRRPSMQRLPAAVLRRVTHFRPSNEHCFSAELNYTAQTGNAYNLLTCRFRFCYRCFLKAILQPSFRSNGQAFLFRFVIAFRLVYRRLFDCFLFNLEVGSVSRTNHPDRCSIQRREKLPCRRLPVNEPCLWLTAESVFDRFGKRTGQLKILRLPKALRLALFWG